MSASTHSVTYIVFSLVGFVALYSAFIVIEMFLLVRAIRLGPTEPGEPDAARPQPRGALAGHAVTAPAAHGEG